MLQPAVDEVVIEDEGTRMAKRKADLQRSRVAFVNAEEDLKCILDQWAAANCKQTVLFVLDCGGVSRLVFLSYMKIIAKVMPAALTARFLAFSGPSLSACAAAEQAVAEHAPKHGTFICKIASASTTSRHSCGPGSEKEKYHISEFVIIAKQVIEIPHTEVFAIPHAVSDMPHKPRSWKALGWTVRCSGGCKCHREGAGQSNDNDGGGIPDDASNAKAFEDLTALPEADSCGGEGKDIYRFMRSKQVYEKVYRDVAMIGSVTGLVVVTTTGCPSSWLAALSCAVGKVVVYAGHVKKHELWHGVDQGDADLFEQERARMGLTDGITPQKTLMNTMQFQAIGVTARGSVLTGILDFWDVPVDWSQKYGGVDVAREVSEAETVELQRQECEDHRLVVQTSAAVRGCVGLFTGAGAGTLPDKAEMLRVPTIWFSTPRHAQSFLALPAHQRFADRLVMSARVPRGGGLSSLYGCMLGVCGEINHSAENANCILKLQPAMGASDGALVLVADARRGIREGSELLLGYDDFNLTLLKGAIDAGAGERPTKRIRMLFNGCAVWLGE